MIARIVTTLIGVVFIVYGVIAAVSPLPAGVVLVFVGVLMIAGANPAARPFIRRARARWRWFDRLVRLAGKHGPRDVRRVAEETTPDHNGDDHDGASHDGDGDGRTQSDAE
ncbi:MAG: hypothetical protein KDA46_08330 [Parvularculaceae bacterium]|nr:hypothetical protein [Parvularculaceae bacterium]